MCLHVQNAGIRAVGLQNSSLEILFTFVLLVFFSSDEVKRLLARLLRSAKTNKPSMTKAQLVNRSLF